MRLTSPLGRSHKYLLGLGVSLLVLSVSQIQYFPQSFAVSQSEIEISSVKSNQQFNDTTAPSGFSGTYFSPDPQTIFVSGVSTLTSAPVITIVIDSRTYGTASLTSATTWSVSGGVIPAGWHTVTAFIDDTNGDKNISIDFLVTSIGHQQPLKYKNIIAIEYSDTCQTLINNNITSDCPPVSELMNWDNSNQKVSGHFRLQSNGLFIREKPQVTNFYSFYDTENYTTVCVLCAVDLVNPDVLPVIWIEPHGYSYAATDISSPDQIVQDPGQDISIANTTVNTLNAKTLTVYHDRYIQGCQTANISYSSFLMSDTINYIKSGCTTTSFNGTTTTVIPYHEFQLNTIATNQANYVKYLNLGHSTNCINTQCDTGPNIYTKSSFANLAPGIDFRTHTTVTFSYSNATSLPMNLSHDTQESYIQKIVSSQHNSGFGWK